MYFPKEGRVTLIKSKLPIFPIYVMLIFPMLVGATKRIEKLQRDFLWGSVEDFFFLISNWPQGKGVEEI